MELKRYTLILRRWFWLLLLAVACAGLASWVFVTQADTSYKPWQVVLFVVLAGLAWGLAGIFGIEFLLDNVKTVEDVRRITPAPLLGTVEMPPRGDRTASGAPFEGPQSKSAPTYLSASLKLLQRGRLGYDRTVLVCSPQRTSHASRVGANLAASAAMSGFPTLLVDANQADGELTQSLNLGDEPGFAEALAQPSSDVLIQLVPSIPNLHVLPGGVRRVAESVTFSSMHLRSIIDRSGAQGSLVVIVGPPVDSQSMLALGLARAADDVVLLAVAEETKRRAMRRAVNRLSEGGANLVGVVFMQRASRRSRRVPASVLSGQTTTPAWTPLPPATPAGASAVYVEQEVSWQGSPFDFSPWGSPQPESEPVPPAADETPEPPPYDAAPPIPVERPEAFGGQIAISTTVEQIAASSNEPKGLDYHALDALGATQQAVEPDIADDLDLEGLDTLGGELAGAGPQRRKSRSYDMPETAPTWAEPPIEEPQPRQPEPEPPVPVASSDIEAKPEMEPEPVGMTPLWTGEAEPEPATSSSEAPSALEPLGMKPLWAVAAAAASANSVSAEPPPVEPGPDIDIHVEPTYPAAAAAAIPSIDVPALRSTIIVDVPRTEPSVRPAEAEPFVPAPTVPKQPYSAPAPVEFPVQESAQVQPDDDSTIEVRSPSAYETMPIPLVPARSADEPLAAPGTLDAIEVGQTEVPTPAAQQTSAAAGPSESVIPHLVGVIGKWLAVAATWRPTPARRSAVRAEGKESPFDRARTGAQLAAAAMVSAAAAGRARTLEKKEARARDEQARQAGMPPPPAPQPVASSTLSSREAALSEDRLINLWLQGAERARRQGDKKGAKDLLDRVLDRDPRNQVAWDMRLALFELPEPPSAEARREARQRSLRPLVLLLAVVVFGLLGAGAYVQWPSISRAARGLVAGGPPTPAPPSPTPVPVATVVSRTFPGTGFSVSGAFLQFWDENGGVRIFGYPISPPLTEFTSDNKVLQVQYFERARLERHPENAGTSTEIMPGLIGDESPVTGTVASTLPEGLKGDMVAVTPSGFEVPTKFYDFWKANGGTAIFGLPISKVLLANVPGGQPMAVQYFERARFEYHPEHAGTPDEIELTRLGIPVYQARHPNK